jgi:DNA-binding response OmpR family regulator
MNILLVEDEQRIADIVGEGLARHAITVEHVDNGIDGYQRALHGVHDVIVLDIMLPGRDGLDILRGLRGAQSTTPVILLTARNELDDRVQGLELGADDYLAKPFHVEELAARIKALARRLSGERQNILQVGELRLDRISRQASYHDVAIDLTSREFNLLEYLMRSPGQVMTRGQILEHVWGYDFDPTTNVVDVCIKRIRAKIAELERGLDPTDYIESVRGLGYRCKRP